MSPEQRVVLSLAPATPIHCGESMSRQQERFCPYFSVETQYCRLFEKFPQIDGNYKPQRVPICLRSATP